MCHAGCPGDSLILFSSPCLWGRRASLQSAAHQLWKLLQPWDKPWAAALIWLPPFLFLSLSLSLYFKPFFLSLPFFWLRFCLGLCFPSVTPKQPPSAWTSRELRGRKEARGKALPRGRQTLSVCLSVCTVDLICLKKMQPVPTSSLRRSPAPPVWFRCSGSLCWHKIHQDAILFCCNPVF